MGLSLRYELHLLAHAFRHDVADPDRPGFHESHLLFYFNKYFAKSIDFKKMGLETFEELCALIKDSVALNEKTKFVEAAMPEDTPLDKFLRHTEEHRRERQRCVDAGDETALLKFTRPAPQRGGGGYQGRSYSGGGSGGRDQWDRNSSRNGQSDRDRGSSGYGDRGGSGYGERSGSGYGDRSSYSQPVGSQQKRPYAPPPPSSSYPPATRQKTDSYGSGSKGGSRGYEAPPPRGYERSAGGGGGSSYGGGGSYGGRR